MESSTCYDWQVMRDNMICIKKCIDIKINGEKQKKKISHDTSKHKSLHHRKKSWKIGILYIINNLKKHQHLVW